MGANVTRIKSYDFVYYNFGFILQATAMHILIATNAFKNSLTATAAADAIRRGLENSRLKCSTECFPVGDGGDGTAQLIIDKFKGTKVKVDVLDPLGRKIRSSFGLIEEGKTAVIEMADASGIRLLRSNECDPLRTSSAGTGDLIRAALDKKVKKIIIGLGGSATVDGGAGMLTALGVKFMDSHGKLLAPNPEAFSTLERVDTSGFDPRISGCEFVVLCDVDNYLLGEKGAAAVFGPQKGAKAGDIIKLDKMLTNLSQLALAQTGRPMSRVKHGGAAGGVAAALYAFCGAQLVHGAEYFLGITGFENSLKKCSIVITGEGSLDTQTLRGKAPFTVASYAKKYQIPVIGIAGSVPLIRNARLQRYFDIMLPIGHKPSDLGSAIADTSRNLARTGTLIGNLISLPGNK